MVQIIFIRHFGGMLITETYLVSHLKMIDAFLFRLSIHLLYLDSNHGTSASMYENLSDILGLKFLDPCILWRLPQVMHTCFLSSEQFSSVLLPTTVFDLFLVPLNVLPIIVYLPVNDAHESGY